MGEKGVHRILIVADMPTHPVIGGNRMCILQNAKILQDAGCSVFFYFYDEEGIYSKENTLCKEFWGENYFYYRPTIIRRFLHKARRLLVPSLRHRVDFYCPNSLVKKINKLQHKYNFQGLLVNYIWLSKLANVDIANKVIYTHDVFSFRSERICSQYKWRSFSPDEEAKALQRFKYVLAIQNQEAVFFSYIAPLSNVVPIYSPMTFVNQPVVEDNNFNILFFSGGGELNILGIKWFIEKVFPLLKERNKGYRLLIGGKICSELKSWPTVEGVEYLGLFENPSEFYLNGNVVINPVYSGTGLKIKTLEGIAHGKYVVTHPHSIEGLYGNAPVYFTDNVEEFAAMILNTIDDIEIINQQKIIAKKYIEDLNIYIRQKYQEIFSLNSYET